MAANSIRKYSTLVDREQIEEYLETATLGQLVGFLRYVRKMESSNFPVPDLETKLGMMILDYLLDQGRRVDHREHRDMVAYLGQVGFEIAHLKTGEGDMKSAKVSIERKEDDLMPSLFDDRRLTQLGAMREEAEYSFLIVTKSYQDVKLEVMERGISENILHGYIASLCAVGYPPLFIHDKYDSAQIINRLVAKIESDNHGLYVPRPKKAKATDYRNAMLEALPSVGPKLRRKIVAEFPTIADLSGASIEDLQEIEGIGKKTAERIFSIMHS
tara:strand:- start:14 stop:829 length:816 start_codon:yes stop_codon:yes gene_type:complete